MMVSRNLAAALALVAIGLMLFAFAPKMGNELTSGTGAPAPTQASANLGAAGPTPTSRSFAATEASPGETSGNTDLVRLPACGTYVRQDLRLASANTVEGLSELSDAVLVGTVLSVSDGRWATSDGQFSSGNAEVPVPPTVYRVVSVRVVEVGKGASGQSLVSGARISVRLLGGTVGCRTYLSSADLPFAVGDNVVLFLGSQPTLNDAPREDYDVIDLWPIVNGLVQGREGTLQPNALLETSAQH